jgi:exodeoxyribonuclease VIII
MEFKEGFVEGLPYEEYAAVDALNFSRLKPMMRSPLAYKYALDNPSEETPAQFLGTLTHRLILEPNLVGEFAVWGELPEQKVRRGKVWDDFLATCDGKEVITVAERDDMVGMAVTVRRFPAARKYLADEGPTEISMFWEENGLRFKGRIDKLIKRKNVTVNLKTTCSCQPYKFGAQAFKFGYYMHEAMYWSGYKILTGTAPKQKIVAVESKAPHESAVYRIPPDVRLQGLEDLQALLDKLAYCEKTNTWPAEMEEESDLVLPSYAMNTVEDDLAELTLASEGE